MVIILEILFINFYYQFHNIGQKQQKQFSIKLVMGKILINVDMIQINKMKMVRQLRWYWFWQIDKYQKSGNINQIYKIDGVVQLQCIYLLLENLYQKNGNTNQLYKMIKVIPLLWYRLIIVLFHKNNGNMIHYYVIKRDKLLGYY